MCSIGTESVQGKALTSTESVPICGFSGLSLVRNPYTYLDTPSIQGISETGDIGHQGLLGAVLRSRTPIWGCRHLTESQRAMVAAKLANMDRGAPKRNANAAENKAANLPVYSGGVTQPRRSKTKASKWCQ